MARRGESFHPHAQGYQLHGGTCDGLYCCNVTILSPRRCGRKLVSGTAPSGSQMLPYRSIPFSGHSRQLQLECPS